MKHKNSATCHVITKNSSSVQQHPKQSKMDQGCSITCCPEDNVEYLNKAQATIKLFKLSRSNLQVWQKCSDPIPSIQADITVSVKGYHGNSCLECCSVEFCQKLIVSPVASMVWNLLNWTALKRPSPSKPSSHYALSTSVFPPSPCTYSRSRIYAPSNPF